MKLGILTPVLTLVPGAHAQWERDATVEDVRLIVQAADRLGYDHVTCSEHVAVPVEAAEVRGGRYWDPLATFGYLAASTSRIRFTTNVLVLGYHHPLAIAKRYGTLDQITNGRLVLGLGVGTLEEEFDLLDAPFADRGARADDALRALRVALTSRVPSYRGTHFEFADMVVEPNALQDHVPFWIGGRTVRSLRRAVELGDGWCPFWLKPERAAVFLSDAAATDAWAARATRLEVVLQNDRLLDPAGAPEDAAAIVRELVAAGATALSLKFLHRSRDHYIEQLEAMVAIGSGQ